MPEYRTVWVDGKALHFPKDMSDAEVKAAVEARSAVQPRSQSSSAARDLAAATVEGLAQTGGSLASGVMLAADALEQAFMGTGPLPGIDDPILRAAMAGDLDLLAGRNAGIPPLQKMSRVAEDAVLGTRILANRAQAQQSGRMKQPYLKDGSRLTKDPIGAAGEILGNAVTNPVKTAGDFIKTGISLAPTVVGGVAGTVVGGPPGGAAVAGMLGGGMEAGSAYVEALEGGMDPQEAQGKALRYGAVSAGLNALGVEAILAKLPKGVFRKIASTGFASLTEAGTESAEEPAQEFIFYPERAKETIRHLVETGELDANGARIAQNMVEVGIPSLIAGGGAHVATNHDESDQAKNDDTKPPTIPTVVPPGNAPGGRPETDDPAAQDDVISPPQPVPPSPAPASGHPRDAGARVAEAAKVKPPNIQELSKAHLQALDDLQIARAEYGRGDISDQELREAEVRVRQAELALANAFATEIPWTEPVREDAGDAVDAEDVLTEDEQDKWDIFLDPEPLGAPEPIELAAEKATEIIENKLQDSPWEAVGDVNMEDFAAFQAGLNEARQEFEASLPIDYQSIADDSTAMPMTDEEFAQGLTPGREIGPSQATPPRQDTRRAMLRTNDPLDDIVDMILRGEEPTLNQIRAAMEEPEMSRERARSILAQARDAAGLPQPELADEPNPKPRKPRAPKATEETPRERKRREMQERKQQKTGVLAGPARPLERLAEVEHDQLDQQVEREYRSGLGEKRDRMLERKQSHTGVTPIRLPDVDMYGNPIEELEGDDTEGGANAIPPQPVFENEVDESRRELANAMYEQQRPPRPKIVPKYEKDENGEPRLKGYVFQSSDSAFRYGPRVFETEEEAARWLDENEANNWREFMDVVLSEPESRWQDRVRHFREKEERRRKIDAILEDMESEPETAPTTPRERRKKKREVFDEALDEFRKLIREEGIKPTPGITREDLDINPGLLRKSASQTWDQWAERAFAMGLLRQGYTMADFSKLLHGSNVQSKPFAKQFEEYEGPSLVGAGRKQDVNEAELEGGDLVRRSGEWYMVKDRGADGKILEDGERLELGNFDDVTVDMRVSRDDPRYEEALLLFKAQENKTNTDLFGNEIKEKPRLPEQGDMGFEITPEQKAPDTTGPQTDIVEFTKPMKTGKGTRKVTTSEPPKRVSDVSEDEFEAMLDAAIEENKAKKEPKPETPREQKRRKMQAKKAEPAPEPTHERTPGDALKSAAENAEDAFKKALGALGELFREEKLYAVAQFDPEKYLRIKDGIVAAYRAGVAAGRDLAEFVRLVVSEFGEGVKPYMIQFYKDMKEEESNAGENERSGRLGPQGVGPHEEVPSEDHGETTTGGKSAGGGPQYAGTGGEDVRGPEAVDRPAAGLQRDAEGRDPATRRGGDRGGDRGTVRLGEQGNDYVITDEDRIGAGGAKTKFNDNIAAIRLLKELEASERKATPEEQAVLVKYVGWGGIPQAFDFNNAKWANEARELRSLLTESEYSDARASTINAHYTSTEVIRAMWAGLQALGFRGGRVVEPAVGIGHFFGLMPDELHANSQLFAVEKDGISARIAAQLYQNAKVMNQPFEDVQMNGEADLFISNVPFANVTMRDKYDRSLTNANLSLHDFYFAKAIKNTREGGLVAFITSSFTLDKGFKKNRELYSRLGGDLVGAIRLPNNAFKKNAGTEVVADLLIFQKRDPKHTRGGEAFFATLPMEVDGIATTINEYYHQHPENVLGTHSMTGSMYASDTYTVQPIDGMDLESTIRERIAAMAEKTKPIPSVAEQNTDNMEDGARRMEAKGEAQFALVVADGALWQRQGDELVELTLPKVGRDAVLARISAGLAVRDRLNDLLALQVSETATDKEVEDARAALNHAYDAFVKKYGYISTPYNTSKFNRDASFPRMLAIEKYDRENKTAEKADIFTKRTQYPFRQPQHADSAKDAMLMSLNMYGHLDFDYMSRLTGKSAEEIQEDLSDQGLVYKEPHGGWQTREQYLSGNVRAKLKLAESAAETDPTYKRNVEALKAVQPEDIPPSGIDVRLGSPWIPISVYEEFLSTITKRYVKVQHGVDGGWILTFGGTPSPAEMNEYGTSHMPASDIAEKLMNHRPIQVTDEIDGHRIVLGDATAAAQAAAEKLQDRFGEWIWEDETRGQALARTYNDIYNNFVPPEYDGSHLTLPGISAAAPELRPHQKAGIWRILNNRNTLLSHVVGAGKTWTMVGAAMELRRTGIAKKPVVVVPNHLIEQWPAEALQLYPGAKVLAATSDDFSPRRRQTMMNRIATGDWDLVIVPMSSFERVPLRPEVMKAFFDKQIQELEDEIRAAKAENGDNRNYIKELEKAKERLAQQLKKMAAEWKKDRAPYFDELGIDALFVDEAHEYKNLWFRSRLTRIPGIQSTVTQKTFDLHMKTQYINSLPNGRIVFATGTPISNTMGEVFTMQRYLQPEVLKNAEIDSFDAWAHQFGNVVTEAEVDPTGGGIRMHSRFAKFVNVNVLSQMWRAVADVKTAEMLNLPRPKLRGGKHEVVESPENEHIKWLVQTFLLRMKLNKNLGRAEKGDDNALNVTTDGRMAATDLRLFNPGFPDLKDSKVNKCVRNVLQIWKETAKDKAAQIIWLDSGIPDEGAPMNLYQDIKDKLVKMGIPASEVAFIHSAKTDAQKDKLFADVRDGRVRVLIGSSKKLSTGANIQNRLYAAHHLDAPWKPSEVEQRDGRILRQGNMFNEVRILRYVQKGSFDAYSWQTLERKASYIEQFMQGNGASQMEDIGETALSYAEVKAIASKDPRIFEHLRLQSAVRKLEAQARAHRDQQIRVNSDYQRAARSAETLPGRIEAAKLDKSTFELNVAQVPKDQKVSISILGKEYTNPAEAALALLDAAKAHAPKNRSKWALDWSPVIGSYLGFDFKVSESPNLGVDYTLNLFRRDGKDGYQIDLGDSPTGNLTRLANLGDHIEKHIKRLENSLGEAKREVAEYGKRLNKPFEKGNELDAKREALAKLEAELQNTSDALSDENLQLAEAIPRRIKKGDPRGPVPEPPAKSVERRSTTQRIEAAAAQWTQRGKVVVLDTFDAAPDAVKKAALKQSGAASIEELDTAGFRYGNTTYLVADVIEAQARDAGVSVEIMAQAKLAHEHGIHFGMRGWLEALHGAEGGKKAVDDFLDDVAASVGRGAMLHTVGDFYESLDDRALAEEYIAHIAERAVANKLSLAERKIWERVLEWVREALRRLHGTTFDAKLDAIIRDSLKWAQGYGEATASDGVRFSIRLRDVHLDAMVDDAPVRLNAEPKHTSLVKLLPEVATQMMAWPESVTGADGRKILLRNPDRQPRGEFGKASLGWRARHLVSFDGQERQGLDGQKWRWLPMIPDTVVNAYAVLNGREGSSVYIRGYRLDGKAYVHAVVVHPKGINHAIYDDGLVTHYPRTEFGNLGRLTVRWKRSVGAELPPAPTYSSAAEPGAEAKPDIGVTEPKLYPDRQANDTTEQDGRQEPRFSAQFRRWFGASKVVNSDGTPRVMYHGTATPNFTTFDKRKQSRDALYGPGFYFTSDPAVAGGDEKNKGYASKGGNGMGGVLPVYLRIENPIAIEEPLTADVAEQLAKGIESTYQTTSERGWGVREQLAFEAEHGATVAEALERVDRYVRTNPADPLSYLTNEHWSRVLQAAGYDGIHHTGGALSGGTKHDVFIAFEPNQIKSATGNTGAFSPETDDIRFSFFRRNRAIEKEIEDAGVKFQDVGKENVWSQSHWFRDVESLARTSLNPNEWSPEQKRVVEFKEADQYGNYMIEQSLEMYNHQLKAVGKRNKQRQKEVRKAMEDLRAGKEISSYHASVQEAAREFVKYFDHMRERIKQFKRWEYQHAFRGSWPAIREVLTGDSVLAAAIRHKMDPADLAEMVEEYQSIDNWGLEDYITNIELGDYVLKVGDKPIARGRTRRAAVQKAMAWLDTAEGKAAKAQAGGNITFTIDTTGMVSQSGPMVYMSEAQRRAVEYRLKQEVQKRVADLGLEIDRAVAKAAVKGTIAVKPTRKWAGPLQKRKEVFRGEDNIFDVLPSYIYAVNKKLALDPVIVKFQEEMHTYSDPNLRKAIEDMIADVKGGHSVMDELIDKWAKRMGLQNRLWSKGMSLTRRVEAIGKLGWRPVSGLINAVGGRMHTWAYVGSKYTRAARRMAKTEEGKALIEQEWPYLGISFASAEFHQAYKGNVPWYHPLWTHNLSEPANRKNAYLATYLYAKGEMRLDEAAARLFARQGVRLTQFTYDMASMPKLLRGQTRRTLFQFKSYMLHEANWILTLAKFQPKSLGKYLLANTVLFGPRFPVYFLRMLPFLGAFAWWDDAEDELATRLGAVYRGVFGMLTGADVTPSGVPQIGTGIREQFGPAVNDAIQAFWQIGVPAGNGDLEKAGEGVARFSKRFMLFWGNWQKAFDAEEHDGWILDSRGKKLYRLDSPWEYILTVAGAKTVGESDASLKKAAK